MPIAPARQYTPPMSRGVLLANFLLMVLLSLVAAALLVFPPAPPPSPEPLLTGFDPAAVTRVELRTRGATHQLVRDPAGNWTLTWGDNPQFTSWPIPETRVRPALRLLAEATLVPGSAPPASDDAVILHLATDPDITITLAGPVAAGRGPVRVAVGATDRTGLTDERLHAVFAQSGLLPWRDDRAMPGVARDPTRLLISTTSDQPPVELTRVQGRWGLIGQVVERADPAIVQSSFDALARLRIDRFADTLDLRSAGLGSPRVSMQAAGGRGPDAYSWRLDIGNPASPDGALVFAALAGTRGPPGAAATFGPVYAVVSLDALSKVFANPEAYLARTALATPAADIRRFSLRTPDGARTWRYERTLDGWRVQSPGAEAARPATAAEARAIPAVLEFLTAATADRVSLRPPNALTPVAILEIEGSAGLVAESISLGRLPPQAGASAVPLAIGGAGAWRIYPGVPEPLAALLPVVP